jgi:hypothetical protein
VNKLLRLALRPFRLLHGAYHALLPERVRIYAWNWRRTRTLMFKQRLRALDAAFMRRGRAELADLRARHALAPGVIIFLPSAPWQTDLFQRPHQMALAFAQLGYLVLYWETPDGAGRPALFREAAPNLYVTDAPGRLLREIPAPIAISYTTNCAWATQLRRPFIVYELIDHLEIFTTFPLAVLRRNHARMLRQARVVVGTADDLMDALRPERPDAILSPNGVDVSHFTAAARGELPVPADIADLVAAGRPIIGYYGALAEWFDAGTVRSVAAQLPDYAFLLIGPDYDFTFTRRGVTDLPNVRWLGPKPYAELPAYLQAFTVATIPFKITEALQAVSPIKLFEYMAGERSIVTSDLLECRKYPVVQIAHTPDEWVALLQRAVAQRGDPALSAQLRQTAAANTWAARCQVILTTIQRLAPAPGATAPAPATTDYATTAS